MLLLAIIFPLTIQQSAVTVSYDRFKDITTIRTRMLATREYEERSTNILDQLEAEQRRLDLTFTASMIRKGESGRLLPVVTLTFYGSNRSPLRFYPEGVPLRTLVDGKRVILPRIRGSGTIGSCDVPLPMFRKLISGKKVEMQIYDTEITLPEETLHALREFDSHTKN